MLKDIDHHNPPQIIVPEWHKDIVRERLIDYKNNPDQALDFNEAMDDIEQVLYWIAPKPKFNNFQQ